MSVCYFSILFLLIFINVNESYAFTESSKKNFTETLNNSLATETIEFIGIENRQFLTGEVFRVRENVQLIVNGEEISREELRIYASNQLDISNVETIWLQHPGTYTYRYEYIDSAKQVHSQNRIITVVNPYKTTVSSTQINDREISILYSIKNEYNVNVTVFLQDWALFPLNHDEEIGDLKIGEALAYEKQFEVVPVFEKSENMPSAPINGNNSDNSEYNTLYTKTGLIGFQPTFEFRNKEINEKLCRFYLETSVDMSDLIEEKRALTDKIEIRTFMPNQNVVLGGEATLVYEVLNNTHSNFHVQVSDWDYFGQDTKIDLGLASSEEKTIFTKKIIVTPEVLNESGQLVNSVNSLYFSLNEREEFVINNRNDILDEVPLAPQVNPVTDLDTLVTGMADGHATIKIAIDETTIAVGEADSDGLFVLTIPTQQSGTILRITQLTDGGESSPTEVTVTQAEETYETTSSFMLGYWQNYGLVMEGQLMNESWDLSSKTGLQGTIQLVNEEGIVESSSPISSTNWYDSTQYNGYQAIIDLGMIEQLSATSDLYAIRVTLKQNGIELANETIEMPLFSGKNGLIQNFNSDFLGLPSNHVGTSLLTTEKKNQHAHLKIEKHDTPIMGLISEILIEEGRAVNGFILNADFDFSQDHQKNVIIETKAGDEVAILENVHTWNLVGWGLGITKLDMYSGFQVVIPTEFNNPVLYQYQMTITEPEDIEVEHLRVLLDKII